MDSKANILSEKLISLASTDYTNEKGFFFHTTAGGAIKYCAKNDPDAGAVTKTFAASETFNNPILARKIFKTGTDATGIYVGFGI
jgi:hypothetical protein